MTQYCTESSSKSLKINFDLDKGLLEITGNSIYGNTIDFFHPLLEALEEYSFKALPNTCVSIHVNYFSASSYKCLLYVFKKLTRLKINGNTVQVNWNYENDFIQELGETYQSVTNLPFQMIQVC